MASKGNKNAVGNNGGRPTKFKPEYIEHVEKLCRLGATDEDLADFFGVTFQTINNWKNSNNEFFEALKRGKIEADMKVADSLYHRAIGYSHPEDKIFNDNGKPLVVPTIKHYPPDSTAAIYWMKVRQRNKWNEKQEIDVTSGGEKISIKPIQFVGDDE